jgi:CBS-domain-containing membrane protein
MKQWRVSDVMTSEVIGVRADTGYKQIADLLVRYGISAVPVVDDRDVVLGVVSEADLLPKLNYPDRVAVHPLVSRRRREVGRKATGETAADLMTGPATTIQREAPVARAARLMEAARVKRLPVVDDAGRLVGIVSRRDLVRLYARSDPSIQNDVIDQVLRGLCIDPSTVDVRVSAGAVTLSGRVDRSSTAAMIVRATHAVPGVVDVVDYLVGEVDDTAAVNSRWHRGHAFSAEPHDVAGRPR